MGELHNCRGVVKRFTRGYTTKLHPHTRPFSLTASILLFPEEYTDLHAMFDAPTAPSVDNSRYNFSIRYSGLSLVMLVRQQCLRDSVTLMLEAFIHRYMYNIYVCDSEFAGNPTQLDDKPGERMVLGTGARSRSVDTKVERCPEKQISYRIIRTWVHGRRPRAVDADERIT